MFYSKTFGVNNFQDKAVLKGRRQRIKCLV